VEKLMLIDLYGPGYYTQGDAAFYTRAIGADGITTMNFGRTFDRPPVVFAALKLSRAHEIHGANDIINPQHYAYYKYNTGYTEFRVFSYYVYTNRIRINIEGFRGTFLAWVMEA
jgi:hypothetical protein